MNGWKKILIIISIGIFLFVSGIGTGYLIYRSGIGEYQNTIATISGRNAELTKENEDLIKSNNRSGAIVDRLKKSSKARLGRIEQLESGIGIIKGITNELENDFGTAEGRLRQIIDTVQQLIDAIEDL